MEKPFKLSQTDDSYFKHREKPCCHCSTHRETEISQYLLKSSHIALYKCGRFLHEAAVFYGDGCEGLAIQRAAGVKTYLDRSCYLEDRWKEALKDETLIIEEIKKALNDHLIHQSWRLRPIVQQFGKGRVAKFSEVLSDSPLESARKKDGGFSKRLWTITESDGGASEVSMPLMRLTLHWPTPT